MSREAISSERFQKDISPPPIEQEPKALAHLKEEFGKYFTPEQLARMSKEPDRLYFYLPPIFNRLVPEKWLRLQNLASEILVREKPSEKVIKFPAEKPTFLERIRKLPATIRALGLGFILTTSALALEAGYLLGREPEKPKIEEVTKSEKPPPGSICTETRCEILMPKKGVAEIKEDLKELLNYSKLIPTDQEIIKDYYVGSYDLFTKQLESKDPSAKENPEIKSLVSQIEEMLKIRR